MERAQGAQTPYEVYCHHCRVTFPREQRRCIHCGGALGRPGRIAELEGKPSKLGEMLGGNDTPEEIEEIEDTGSMLLRRFGGLAVWAVLALAAVLSNMCQGQD